MALPSVAAKTRSAALIVALFAACHAASATMLNAPADCGAPDSLQCRADSVLNLLYGISYVLGFVLIVIVIIALRIYLRNRKRKNLLHD